MVFDLLLSHNSFAPGSVLPHPQTCGRAQLIYDYPENEVMVET